MSFPGLLTLGPEAEINVRAGAGFDVNAYGRAQAARKGIHEEDVERLVHEVRADAGANKRAAKK